MKSFLSDVGILGAVVFVLFVIVFSPVLLLMLFVECLGAFNEWSKSFFEEKEKP